MIIKVALTAGFLASSGFAFTAAQGASSEAIGSILMAQSADEEALPAELEDAEEALAAAKSEAKEQETEAKD